MFVEMFACFKVSLCKIILTWNKQTSLQSNDRTPQLIVAHGGEQFTTDSCYMITLGERGMPPSELVGMQLVMRQQQHHRTPTCVDTAGEPAVAASASWATKEHAKNNEDVTHDSHRRIDGQHYYYAAPSGGTYRWVVHIPLSGPDSHHTHVHATVHATTTIKVCCTRRRAHNINP